MESPNDIVLQKDFDEIVESNTPFDELNGKTVFITGATGLIGSQFIKSLACYNRKKGSDIKLVAFVRSAEKAQKVFGDIPNIEFVIGNITDKIEYKGDVDYIVHGASATSSKYFVEHPVETIKTAIDGTTSVLEFAKEKKVEGFVYLSSLEVYGTPNEKSVLIGEDDYGYIDPLNVRSSYSEGKRMVECLCCSYAGEYNVPIKIARLSQTFGAGVEYNDGRVFAEFARCAIEKKDIVLHTQGNTVRSYCYTTDAVSAITYILLKGKTGEAYNVTNMSTACSIKEMAQLVCDIFEDSGIQVKIDIPDNIASFGYNPEMIIRLDSSKLEGLGWKASVSIEEMFKRLVASMKNE
ncbi:MAG: NAD-dependent epimerase/dehydratase family protein [Eubacterium sp.]|nr:NAD-dependent epimerase/dehydratase family protein [Eubacterium sp.]